MQYIDKSKHKAEGTQVTTDYLRNCCIDELGQYCNIDYAGTFHTAKSDNGKAYSKLMEMVLMENQQRYCCYCMRKIDGSEMATLEHIIPQSLNSTQGKAAQELAFYQRMPELAAAEIALTDTFKGKQATMRQPLPHTVAYNNLVVSCAGTFPDKLKLATGNPIACCCNHERKNKRALPVYFLQHIASMVDYLKHGEVRAVRNTDWTNDIDEVIHNASLNCKSLQQIRYMWFVLSDCDINEIYLCSSNADKRKKLLCEMLFSDKAPNKDDAFALFNKFNKQDYWDTFMHYQWFYHVYRQSKQLTAE